MSAQNSAQLDEVVTESIIELMVKKQLINWCIKLLQKQKKSQMHVFCLDFSSALLANLLHASTTLETLEGNQS